MKKLALIIVLTISFGLVGGIMVSQASAFGFSGGKWGGYGCGYGMPYYYGVAPYWGWGYGPYPGYYWGPKWKKYGKKMKAAGEPKGPGASKAKK
jgi:hypothetical protein